MDDDLYRALATHAKTHAASKGLSDDYAMGFLNAMWYTVDAAVRDRQAQTTAIREAAEVLQAIGLDNGTFTGDYEIDRDERALLSWLERYAPTYDLRPSPSAARQGANGTEGDGSDG